jgi:hypothetical protein
MAGLVVTAVGVLAAQPEHAPRGVLPALGIAMVLAGLVIIVKSGEG